MAFLWKGGFEASPEGGAAGTKKAHQVYLLSLKSILISLASQEPAHGSQRLPEVS
jgi:hypothetical protein